MADISEVSQIDESHPGDAAKHDDQGNAKWILACLCVLALLAVMIGVVVFLSRTSSQTAGGDESSSDGPAGPVDPPVDPVVRTVSTVSVTVSSDPGQTTDRANTSSSDHVTGSKATVETGTTATTVSMSTTAERTKKPYTGVTPKQLAIPRGWFICVTRPFGRIPNQNVSFPEDGVCDLIYYDRICSIGRMEYNMFSQDDVATLFASGSGPYLTHAAATYTKSQFGAGFCWVVRSRKLLANERTRLDTWLGYLAEHNIHHTGIFDFRDAVPRTGLFLLSDMGVDDVRGVLELLRAMKEFVSPNPSARSSVRYTILSVEVKKAETIGNLTEFFRSVHTPDAILVSGHLWQNKDIQRPKKFSPYDRVPCQLVPPNNYFDPSTRNWNSQQAGTMADHVQLLLRFKRAGINAHYSMMLTMGAARHQMRFPDNRNPARGNYAAYMPCLYKRNPREGARDFEDPKRLCADPDSAYYKNMQYQDDARTWITFDKDKSREFSIAFDTEDTLRWKACNTMAGFVGELIGVAAIDVDFDNSTSNCPGWTSAPFNRVKLLKAINTFVQTEFWDPSDLYFCLRLQPSATT